MERRDIPVTVTKVDGKNGDRSVEAGSGRQRRSEPVLSPEALDGLMARVEANGLELLGPDGVLASSRR